jgi:hypothetical protein
MLRLFIGFNTYNFTYFGQALRNCVALIVCRLAQRIVRGDVPEPLQNRKVKSPVLFENVYLITSQDKNLML